MFANACQTFDHHNNLTNLAFFFSSILTMVTADSVVSAWAASSCTIAPTTSMAGRLSSSTRKAPTTRRITRTTRSKMKSSCRSSVCSAGGASKLRWWPSASTISVRVAHWVTTESPQAATCVASQRTASSIRRKRSLRCWKMLKITRTRIQAIEMNRMMSRKRTTMNRLKCRRLKYLV